MLNTIRNARSRASGGYFVALLLTPTSHVLEPPEVHGGKQFNLRKTINKNSSLGRTVGGPELQAKLPRARGRQTMKNVNNWLKGLFLIAGIFASSAAMAQCCGHGGVGVHAMTGLGDSNLKVANSSIDPSLAIYELHRDGVTYLQINDVTGVVRAVVARVDNALWTLPMGKDVERVVLPSANKISASKGSNDSATFDASQSDQARLVYKTNNFTVLTRNEATGDQWIVSP